MFGILNGNIIEILIQRQSHIGSMESIQNKLQKLINSKYFLYSYICIIKNMY